MSFLFWLFIFNEVLFTESNGFLHVSACYIIMSMLLVVPLGDGKPIFMIDLVKIIFLYIFFKCQFLHIIGNNFWLFKKLISIQHKTIIVSSLDTGALCQTIDIWLVNLWHLLLTKWRYRYFLDMTFERKSSSILTNRERVAFHLNLKLTINHFTNFWHDISMCIPISIA